MAAPSALDLVATADFRHVVTIQQPTTTPDGQGGWAQAWATFITAWAHVMPAQGAEKTDGGGVRAEGTVVFRLRYRPGVSEQMRVSWEGNTYNITSVVDVEARHIFLDVAGRRGE